MLDPKLLEILACPVCKTEVKLEGDLPAPRSEGQGESPARQAGRLVCVQCGRRYPIRDGIPVMLVEEAEQPKEAKPS